MVDKDQDQCHYYKQEYGYNYDQTYSPIIQYTSFKLILLMKIKINWIMNKVFIKKLLLNNQLDGEVFI